MGPAEGGKVGERKGGTETCREGGGRWRETKKRKNTERWTKRERKEKMP